MFEKDSDSLNTGGGSPFVSKGVFIRFGLLGLVLILAIGYMIYAAFPGNTLYFLTVSELMEADEYKDGRMVRVSGKLLEGTFHREQGSTHAAFSLVDSDGPSSLGMEASYVGVMPDLFFNPHSEIILQGHYDSNDVFDTDTILVKCPSKYQALEEEYENTESTQS